MRSVQVTLPLLLLLGSSGCSMVTNPMLREGTWHPRGANAANLAAMVANPNDLVSGEAAEGAPGAVAVAPVEALKADKVKPLPENSIITLGGTTTGSSGGASAAGAGGY